ncbi:MAG TPA: hypothetical protein PLS95_15040 [Thermoanaerobaculales bacterium]|nr:hypothetical protein [Thermoanaerobaculales bacterium]
MAVAKKSGATAEPLFVSFERPQRKTLQIAIEGTPPGLLMHRFGHKAKAEMEDKQTKKATKGKEARDPEAEYEDCLYKLAKPNGTAYGFPARGFKAALISSASRFIKDFARQSPTLRGAIFIAGEAPLLPEDGLLVPIYGEWIKHRSTVRLAGKTCSLAYRPLFERWTAELFVTIDESVLSADQLYAMVERAGCSVGIGDGRIERSEMDHGGWVLVDAPPSGALAS